MGSKVEQLLNQKVWGMNLLTWKNLLFLVDPERKENITLLLAIHVEQLETVTKIINRVVGDLSEPDTGILFSLPIDYIQGLKF